MLESADLATPTRHTDEVVEVEEGSEGGYISDGDDEQLGTVITGWASHFRKKGGSLEKLLKSRKMKIEALANLEDLDHVLKEKMGEEVASCSSRDPAIQFFNCLEKCMMIANPKKADVIGTLVLQRISLMEDEEKNQDTKCLEPTRGAELNTTGADLDCSPSVCQKAISSMEMEDRAEANKQGSSDGEDNPGTEKDTSCPQDVCGNAVVTDNIEQQQKFEQQQEADNVLKEQGDEGSQVNVIGSSDMGAACIDVVAEIEIGRQQGVCTGHVNGSGSIGLLPPIAHTANIDTEEIGPLVNDPENSRVIAGVIAGTCGGNSAPNKQVVNCQVTLGEGNQSLVQIGGTASVGKDPNPVSMSNTQSTRDHSSWADKVNFGCNNTSGRKSIGKEPLEFISPAMVERKPVIHIESKDYTHVQKRHENLVIGTFVGRRLPYGYVKGICSKVWGLNDRFNMESYGEKMYSFEFTSEADRSAVLDLGSFHIANKLFIIKPWRLLIEAEEDDLKTIPIWVIFKHFPMELWDKKGFSQVGSAIGIPLFTDRKTGDRIASKIARVCIEIDTNCDYPSEIPVIIDHRREISIQVEYNWLPPKCQHCKVFGHSENLCPKQAVARSPGEPLAENCTNGGNINQLVNDIDGERQKRNNSGNKANTGVRVNSEWKTPQKKHTFKSRRSQVGNGHGRGDKDYQYWQAKGKKPMTANIQTVQGDEAAQVSGMESSKMGEADKRTSIDKDVLIEAVGQATTVTLMSQVGSHVEIGTEAKSSPVRKTTNRFVVLLNEDTEINDGATTSTKDGGTDRVSNRGKSPDVNGDLVQSPNNTGGSAKIMGVTIANAHHPATVLVPTLVGSQSSSRTQRAFNLPQSTDRPSAVEGTYRAITGLLPLQLVIQKQPTHGPMDMHKEPVDPGGSGPSHGH